MCLKVGRLSLEKQGFCSKFGVKRYWLLLKMGFIQTIAIFLHEVTLSGIEGIILFLYLHLLCLRFCCMCFMK